MSLAVEISTEVGTAPFSGYINLKSTSMEKVNFEPIDHAPLVFMICFNAGYGGMSWSPLAGGILSGKYELTVPPNSRASLEVWIQAWIGLTTWIGIYWLRFSFNIFH